MAITVVESGAAAGVINGNNVTNTFVASLQQNDLVVLFGGHPRPASNAGANTAGYTEDQDQNTTLCRGIAAYKFMGATPDTNVVGLGSGNSLDAASYCYIVLRGVDTTTPLDTATTTTISTGAIDPPSITTVTAGAMVVAGFIKNAVAASTSAPSGYSNLASNFGNDSNDICCGVAAKLVASPGAENPGTFGGLTGAQGYVCYTMAFRPLVRSVTADAGSYTLTGTNAATELGREVAAGAGSYALTGTDVTFSRGKSVVAASGSYTLTGVDASIEVGRRVTAEAGSYALTGVNASLERGLEIVPDAGSYVLTGTDADLILTTVGGKTLIADPGSYVLTGQDAALEWGREVTAEAGSYELTGQSVNLVLPAVIVAAESQAALICAVGRLLSRR